MKSREAMCLNCMKMVEYEIKEEEREASFGTDVTVYKAKIAVCKECGEEVYVMGLDDVNVDIAMTAYREKANTDYLLFQEMPLPISNITWSEENHCLEYHDTDSRNGVALKGKHDKKTVKIYTIRSSASSIDLYQVGISMRAMKRKEEIAPIVLLKEKKKNIYWVINGINEIAAAAVRGLFAVQADVYYEKDIENLLLNNEATQIKINLE